MPRQNYIWGFSWKIAPLDEALVKLRDYFGKESLHMEYQVKSKAAKAVAMWRNLHRLLHHLLI